VLPKNGSAATSWQPLAFLVALDGDNRDVSCPTCTRLDRDEAFVSEAIEEGCETLRYALAPEERAAVEEERILAALLSRIIEPRAA
jgi:hypothetical protein